MKKKPNPEIFFFLWKRRKILLTMKLLLCFILFSMLNVSGGIYSQSSSIHIAVNGKTVREVFKDIENQSKYRFLYNDDFVGLNNIVSINAIDQPISDVLNELLGSAHLSYRELENDLIVITPLDAAYKQHGVRGRVSELSTGDPLPGVNIFVKGTTIGTTTNIDGEYSLEVSGPDIILVFSFVGYLSQEIIVGEQSVIDINLTTDLAALEEVVVVGYGSMQRRHLTGAIGSVQMEDMAYRPSGEFGQSLYGQIPGVQIRNTSGRPGQSSTIQVRGINSISASATPLIVVDGVILPDYDLSNINSADIESIDILKDAASAAIYGSRGANGVILISTKSGTVGAPSLTINHTSTVQQLIRRIEGMNSAQYAEASIDAAQNGWIDSGGDPNAPNTIEARGHYKYTWPVQLENPETLPNTDWYDVVYRLAPMYKTDLSLAGGDGSTTYYISGGVLHQDGIMKRTDFQKYSLNLKIDSKITNWFGIGGMLNTNLDYENRSGDPAPQTRMGALEYPPIYNVYGEDGYLGGPQNHSGFENYNAILFRVFNGHPLHRGGGHELLDIKRMNTIGSIYGEVSILPGLVFRSSFNGFLRRSEQTYYMGREDGRGPNVTRVAQATADTGETFNYTALNQLSYSNLWNDHQIDALAGYEFNHSEFYGINAQRRNYDNDLVPYLSAGSLIFAASDNAWENNMISLFSRVNYNYQGKYMASVTFRRDGSSRFGPENKWGNFPSFSAGWRASEENFMENIDLISNLTFRFSYGYTGNHGIGNYAWVSSMSQSRTSFGNNVAITYFPGSVQNPDLRWERTVQQNFGFNIGVLNNRIYLETDIYKSLTDDLLLNVPIPSTSGFNTVLRNIGSMQNTGFETKLTTRNSEGALGWTTSITLGANKNKITSLGPDDAPMFYNPGFAMDMINMVGHPVYSFYGLMYDGVYMNQAEIDADPASYPGANPGDGRYKDLNGDGVINADDRTIIGDYQPDFTWSLSNALRFRSFDLSFLFQGAHNFDILNLMMHRSFMYHEGRNYHSKLVNRWRSEDQPGDGHHYKLSVDLAQFDLYPSSFFIEDASYIKLQEVTFGYNLPREIVNRLGVGSARIYFLGTNLFLWTEAEVYDPENMQSSPDNMVLRGSNHAVYPSTKTYSFGINVNF
ncbi:MAG: TonB-dependent receptor [Bacteroidales bacterium]